MVNKFYFMYFIVKSRYTYKACRRHSQYNEHIGMSAIKLSLILIKGSMGNKNYVKHCKNTTNNMIIACNVFDI